MKKIISRTLAGLLIFTFLAVADEIHDAAQKGDLQRVRELLEANPNLANQKDSGFGRTPLHWAARGVHLDVLRLLLEKGADPKAEDNSGITALHSACEGGLAKIVEILIEKDFYVNKPDRYGFSPLHYTARNGHKETAEVLLRNKADINAANLAGERPVHLARRAGKQDFAAMLIALGADPGPQRFPDLRGEYLGQQKPGKKPEIFAVGIVSSIDWEHSSPAFSPEGREVFWTSISDGMNIFLMSKKDAGWTAPALASFSGFEDCYPRFSPDGKRLYYVSYRALKEGQKNAGIGINLWSVRRTERGWSEPRPVGPPFDNGNIFGFSMTDDGTVYFTDARSGFDIFRSILINGRYAAPEKLGPSVNSENVEDEPFISPDESYLIFKSMRPGGLGDADLYISFRRADGSWSEAKNLGPDINTEHAERFPSVTCDGKFFFFGSDRDGNRGDIYWVSSEFIEGLRPENSTAGIR